MAREDDESSSLGLVLKALEVAFFGRAGEPDALGRLNRALGGKCTTTDLRRFLGEMVSGALLPPIVQLDDGHFAACAPMVIVGIYPTKEQALEALRPVVQSPPQDPPLGPHGFNAMAAMGAHALPQCTYMEHALITLIFAKHSKPLPPGEPSTRASDYVPATKLPRKPHEIGSYTFAALAPDGSVKQYRATF